MGKYKFVIYQNGSEIYESYEEYGDIDYSGTFPDEDSAADAALYYIGCASVGGEILELTGDYDGEIIDTGALDYWVEEIDD